ncbi:ABC transporter permease [Cohnella abietis]|uniref:Putative multiple-sugar transport system permease YteP n=1 Tax=Cohnella abietis TaxID=2507935 RepID=A0A3T1D1E8_9BACL|nr:ABC transporter permease subunit [Cohnella abietis]BBI31914.1 putative multiple-sugar transport system permease YteP [Cohnella abietis]
MQKVLFKEVAKHKYMYLLVAPVLVYYILFAYLPMYGIVLAFKDFDYSKGITGSPWVGLKHFQEVIQYSDFWNAFNNTLIISLGRLIFEFPAPIILALLLNEVTRYRLKKFFQTVFTFPHFLSWVILGGIITNFLGDSGVFNQLLVSIGLEKRNLLVEPSSFRYLLFLTDTWREIGWGAILYLAAIAGINPELYEAAHVDGANRFQQLKAVTWPSIRYTASILFILAVGNAMNGGFDQIFNLYNSVVYDVADILDTYVYRYTFITGDSFSISTAVGLIKSIINFALLIGANYLVRYLGEEGVT